MYKYSVFFTFTLLVELHKVRRQLTLFTVRMERGWLNQDKDLEDVFSWSV